MATATAVRGELKWRPPPGPEFQFVRLRVVFVVSTDATSDEYMYIDDKAPLPPATTGPCVPSPFREAPGCVVGGAKPCCTLVGVWSDGWTATKVTMHARSKQLTRALRFGFWRGQVPVHGIEMAPPCRERLSGGN